MARGTPESLRMQYSSDKLLFMPCVEDELKGRLDNSGSGKLTNSVNTCIAEKVLGNGSPIMLLFYSLSGMFLYGEFWRRDKAGAKRIECRAIMKGTKSMTGNEGLSIEHMVLCCTSPPAQPA